MGKESGPKSGSQYGREGSMRGDCQWWYICKGFFGGVVEDELLLLVEGGDGGNQGRHARELSVLEGKR